MANKSVGSISIDAVVNTAKFEGGLTQITVKASAFSKQVKKSFLDIGKPLQDLRNMMLASFSVAGAVQLAQFFNTIDSATRKMNVNIMAARKGTVDFAKTAKDLYSELPTSIENVTASVQALANRTKLTGDAFKEAARYATALTGTTGDAGATGATLVAMKKWNVDPAKFKDFANYIHSLSVEAGLGSAGIKALTDGLINADNTLGKFGFTVEGAAQFMADLEANGFASADIIGKFNIAIAKMVGRNGIQNLSQAWEKMSGDIKNAASHTERIKVATEYFGSKAANDMVDVFESVQLKLKGGSVAMHDLVGDMKETETPLQKFQKAVESIAVSMSKVVDSFESVGKEMKKYDLLGAMNELTFGGAQLGAGALKVSPISVGPNGDGGLGIGKSSTPAKSIKEVASAAQEAVAPVVKLTEANTMMNSSLADTAKTATWTNRSLDQLFGELPDWQSRIEDFGKNLKDNITDSFTDVILQTKSLSEAFRSMVASIISYIARLTVEQSIARPIAGALTNWVGGMFNGSVATNAGSMGIGDFVNVATGVAAGGGYIDSPTLIGEHGPEVFVPDVAGTVIPNEALGGSSVTVNQYNTFSGGSSESVMNALNKTKSQIATMVADQVQRGGRLSRKIRG